MSEILDAHREVAAVTMEPAITLQDLTVRFGSDVLAVDQANLSIMPGEFVSFVGPSGCGKTTILNILTGLLPLQQGQASILGRVPRPGNPDIAYMLARDCLLPWRTVLSNACFGMEVRGVARSQREEKAKALLADVGLGQFIHAYPKALSHGMRQRCALARTFCLDAPVLLMDEPFGALDAQTKLQLEDVLLRLWASQQRTVVFITHDLAEAVALSDRVIVMSPRPGRIVADIPVRLPRPRSVRELQKDPDFHHYYAKLWTLLEQGMHDETE
jgi:NitT/TauT family transport system ATP-binding protein